jgi:hypothetical protein
VISLILKMEQIMKTILFVNNGKRGGISHGNKKGNHTNGVVSVDITSQYPASMI